MKNVGKRIAAFISAAIMLAGIPGLSPGDFGSIINAITAYAADTEMVGYYDENGEWKTAECVVVDGTTQYTSGGWYYIKQNLTYDYTYALIPSIHSYWFWNVTNADDINIIVADGADLTGFMTRTTGNVRFYGQNLNLSKAGTLHEIGSFETDEYGFSVISDPLYKSLTFCNINFTGGEQIGYTLKNVNIYNSDVEIKAYSGSYSFYYNNNVFRGSIKCYSGKLSLDSVGSINSSSVQILGDNVTLQNTDAYNATTLDLTGLNNITLECPIQVNTLKTASNVRINGPLTAKNIILNGGTLSVYESTGTNYSAAITINDGGSITCSENSKLIAVGSSTSVGAGIYAKGALTIRNATIEATGGKNGAGIGGGFNQQVGRITIENSNIKAIAGEGCEHGIGSGTGGTDNGFVIKDSTINSYLHSGNGYDGFESYSSAEFSNSIVNGIHAVKKTDYAGETELTDGTYAVKGNQNISDRILIRGNVQLILAAGTEMNVEKGFEVPEGSTLTVSAEYSENLGSLTVSNPEDGKAGIGGGGKIVLERGNFEIHGGKNAAAIGGNQNGSAGSVILNWNVTAYGGENAAAIGGGAGSTGGSVLLTGSTFHAYAGSGAPSGIGAGMNGTLESIRIENADVASENGSGAADGLAEKEVNGIPASYIVFKYSTVNDTPVNDFLDSEEEAEPDKEDDALNVAEVVGFSFSEPDFFDQSDTISNPFGKSINTANRCDEILTSRGNFYTKGSKVHIDVSGWNPDGEDSIKSNWKGWTLFGHNNIEKQEVSFGDDVLADSSTFSEAVGGNFDGNRQAKKAQYAVVYLDENKQNVYLGVRDASVPSVGVRDLCLATKQDFYGTVSYNGDYQNRLRIVTGDFDNNGVDEIAVYNSGEGCISVYKLTNFKSAKYLDTANWTLSYTINIGKYKNVSMTTADTDRNGLDDLIISANGKITVYSGARNTMFSAENSVIDMSGINNTAVDTFDENGTGQKTIAAAGYTDSGSDVKGCIRFYEYDSKSGGYRMTLESKDLSMFSSSRPDQNINFAYLGKKPFTRVSTNESFEGNLFYLNSVFFIQKQNQLVQAGQDLLSSRSIISYHTSHSWDWDNGFSCTWDVVKEEPTMRGAEYKATVAKSSNNDYVELLITKYNGNNWFTYKLPINMKREQESYLTLYEFDGGLNPSLYTNKVLYDSMNVLWKDYTDYPKTCLSPQYQASGHYFYVTVNTDNDTAYMEYTGKHSFEYSDPKVLAVLASPPYFKDLLNLNKLSGNYAESSTSYGRTQGTGNGETKSSTISTSKYFEYGYEVEVFGYVVGGMGGQTSFEYGETTEFSEMSSVEYSSNYSTSSGEDKVVLYTVPYVTYEYTMHVFDNAGNMKHIPARYVLPLTPGVTTMNYDDYQVLAENYSSFPQLDKDLLTHTLGDPSTYPKSAQGYRNAIVNQDDFAIVGFSGVDGGSTSEREIVMGKEHEKAFSTSSSFVQEQWEQIGSFLKIGTGEGEEHEAGTVTVTTEGSTLGASMQDMPIEAKDFGYYLAWNLFAYESSSQSGGETVTFPVVSYIVSDVQAPPVLPEDIEQDYDETTDHSITLTWSYDQPITGFNIYRTYNFPSGVENLLVGTVYSTDAEVVNGVQHYSFTDEGLNPYTDYEYHIEAVRADKSEYSMRSDAITAITKSAVGYPEFSIQGLNDDGKLTVYPDSVAAVTVVIDNPDDARSNIMYQWQKRDENGDWHDISGAVSEKYSFTGSSFASSGEYRCRVNSIYYDKTAAQRFYLTAYTDSFEAVYTLRTAISTSGLKVSCDENGILSATISLVSDQRTHNVAPTGTVTFRFKGTNGTTSYNVPITTNGRTATATLSDVNSSALANGVYEVTAVYNGNRIFGSYESEQAILLIGNSSYHAVLFNQATGDETNTAVYGEGIGYYIEKYTVAADGKITKEIVNNDVEIPDSKTQAAGTYTYTDEQYDCGTLTYTIQKRPIVIGLNSNTSAEIGKVEGNLPQLKLIEGSLYNDDALSSLAEISFKDSSGNAVNAPDNTTLPSSFTVMVTPKNSDKYSIECKNGTFDVTSAQYTLKAQVSGKGTVSMTKPDTISVEELKNGKKYTAGTEVSFTAVPENGYKITRWTVKTKNGSTNYNGSNTLTFNLSASDTNVTVWFAPYYYKLSVYDAEGGSYQCSTSFTNGTTYPSYTEKTFTATSDANYHFVRWQKYTGSKYEEITTPEITVSMMDGNIDLYPVFALDTHKLTLDSKLNAYYYYDHDGKVSTPDIKKSIVSGDAIPFGTEVTVSLKDGEALADGDKILLNENEIALTNGTYTFTMNQDSAFCVDEPNKMYTVSVTPKDTAGNDVPAQFNLLSSYANGAEVTLEAPSVDGYNFVGWYNGTEKLTSQNQYTFTIHENADLTAKYEAIGRVSLTINCEGIFTINGDEQSSTNKTDYSLGSCITVITENPDFAYWTNSYGMILSRSASYTFTVTGTDTISAVINTPIANKATLVFESAYGQVMARTQLAVNGKMNIPSAPYYNGYTALGWDLNGDGNYDANDTLANAISRGLAAEDKVAKIMPVYELNDVSYTITINGGTGSGTYNQNAEVVVTADDAPDGQKFSCWKDADGKEISYNARFTFLADRDWEMTAEYVNESAAIDAKGVTLITSKSKDESAKTMTFVSYSNVPEGFTIEKAGIIATGDATVAASGEGFNADTARVVRGDAWSGASYRYSWTASGMTAGTTIYVRAYLVYTDLNGNKHTVYGNVDSLTY